MLKCFLLALFNVILFHCFAASPPSLVPFETGNIRTVAIEKLNLGMDLDEAECVAIGWENAIPFLKRAANKVTSGDIVRASIEMYCGTFPADLIGKMVDAAGGIPLEDKEILKQLLQRQNLITDEINQLKKLSERFSYDQQQCSTIAENIFNDITTQRSETIYKEKLKGAYQSCKCLSFLISLKDPEKGRKADICISNALLVGDKLGLFKRGPNNKLVQHLETFLPYCQAGIAAINIASALFGEHMPSQMELIRGEFDRCITIFSNRFDRVESLAISHHQEIIKCFLDLRNHVSKECQRVIDAIKEDLEVLLGQIAAIHVGDFRKIYMGDGSLGNPGWKEELSNYSIAVNRIVDIGTCCKLLPSSINDKNCRIFIEEMYRNQVGAFYPTDEDSYVDSYRIPTDIILPYRYLQYLIDPESTPGPNLHFVPLSAYYWLWSANVLMDIGKRNIETGVVSKSDLLVAINKLKNAGEKFVNYVEYLQEYDVLGRKISEIEGNLQPQDINNNEKLSKNYFILKLACQAAFPRSYQRDLASFFEVRSADKSSQVYLLKILEEIIKLKKEISQQKSQREQPLNIVNMNKALEAFHVAYEGSANLPSQEREANFNEIFHKKFEELTIKPRGSEPINWLNFLYRFAWNNPENPNRRFRTFVYCWPFICNQSHYHYTENFLDSIAKPILNKIIEDEGIYPLDEEVNDDKDRLLHIAVRSQDIDLLKLLVEHVPLEVLERENAKRETALTLAIQNHDVEMVEVLLSKGLGNQRPISIIEEEKKKLITGTNLSETKKKQKIVLETIEKLPWIKISTAFTLLETYKDSCNADISDLRNIIDGLEQVALSHTNFPSRRHPGIDRVPEARNVVDNLHQVVGKISTLTGERLTDVERATSSIKTTIDNLKTSIDNGIFSLKRFKEDMGTTVEKHGPVKSAGGRRPNWETGRDYLDTKLPQVENKMKENITSLKTNIEEIFSI